MSTYDTTAEESTATPANYSEVDTHHGPTWTHDETGLRVELRADGRPQGGEMTAATAMQPDDPCWTFAVRPDGGDAEIYERLSGGRDGALEHAREWMADHADGVLTEAA